MINVKIQKHFVVFNFLDLDANYYDNVSYIIEKYCSKLKLFDYWCNKMHWDKFYRLIVVIVIRFEKSDNRQNC